MKLKVKAIEDIEEENEVLKQLRVKAERQRKKALEYSGDPIEDLMQILADLPITPEEWDEIVKEPYG